VGNESVGTVELFIHFSAVILSVLTTARTVFKYVVFQCNTATMAHEGEQQIQAPSPRHAVNYAMLFLPHN